MKAKLISIFKFALFLGIGLGLIWLSTKDITSKQWDEIYNSAQGINWAWMLLSGVLVQLSHISRTMRWQMLMEPLGKKPRFLNTYFAILIGYFGNLAINRMGEAARCGIIQRYEGLPVDKVFGTVIVDRAVDMISLLVILFLGLVLQYEVIGSFFNEMMTAYWGKFLNLLSGDFWYLAMALILSAAVIGFIAFLFKKMAKRAWKILGNIGAGMKAVKDVKSIPLFIFHSIFIWLMYFLMIYACFQALPLTASLAPSVGLVVLGFGTFGIILTPGGVGAYPEIVKRILALYNIPAHLAYGFGTIIWALQTLVTVVGGFIALVLLPIINRK